VAPTWRYTRNVTERKSLLTAVRAGQAAGATLQRRAVVGAGNGAPDRAELREHLDAAAAKVEGTLAQRVLALSLLRGVEQVLAGEDGPELSLAQALHRRLSEREAEIFGPVRDALRSGAYGPQQFREDLARLSPEEQDAFAERLLDLHDPPVPEKRSDALHAPHGLSPLADVLDAAGHVDAGDVVYDLGAGSGKVCLLLRFLTGARVVGVEYDGVLVREAERVRDALGLQATFLEADVREVTCEDATVFFMYEPFRGEILRGALAMIRTVASRHPVRLIARFKTYDALAEVEGLRPLVPPGPSGQQVFEVAA
jgi:hypothetical protein